MVGDAKGVGIRSLCEGKRHGSHETSVRLSTYKVCAGSVEDCLTKVAAPCTHLGTVSIWAVCPAEQVLDWEQTYGVHECR